MRDGDEDHGERRSSKKKGVRPAEALDPKPVELALIGFMLLHPERFYQAAMIRPVHFSDQSRSQLWEIILEQIDVVGRGLTPALVAEQAVRRGIFPNVMAATDFLVDAQDNARNAADPESAGSTFCSQVLDYALRRYCKDTARNIHNAAEEAVSTEEVRGEVQGAIFELLNFETVGTQKPLEVVLQEEHQRIESQQPGEPPGLMSGISGLDVMWNGFRPGEFGVIAARPSVGKTALGTQLALEWAVKGKHAGGIWSLEMSKGSLVQRLACQHAGTDLHRVIRNDFDRDALARYRKALGAISEAVKDQRLTIMDAKRLDGRVLPKGITDIVAEIRYWRNRMKLEWVMVDYIQLISGIRRKGESREREVASVSQLLKQVAAELEIPVIGLCQIKRPDKDHTKKRPRIHELRESGSIEQDADIIVLIHNWAYVNDSDDKPATRATIEAAELILGKQRNGRTGIARVDFVTACGNFRDRTASYEGDAGPGEDSNPWGSSGPTEPPT